MGARRLGDDKSHDNSGLVQGLEEETKRLIVALGFLGILLTEGLSISGLLDRFLGYKSAAWELALLTWIVYFSSWVTGGTADLSVQRKAYFTVPVRDLPLLAKVYILSIFVLVVAVGWFCLYESIRPMAFVLLLLWIVDHVSWRYMVNKFVLPSSEKSRVTYMRNEGYIELEKLNTAVYRVKGHWKWYRFAAGTIIVFLMNWIAWFGVPKLPFLRDNCVGLCSPRVFLHLCVGGGNMDLVYPD